MTKKIRKTRKSNKPKKHIVSRIISSFIKSFFLIVLISTIYFLTLIAVEYKSFSFITAAIEEGANKNLPTNSYIKINKSYIKFNSLHKIKVRIDDVRLINKNQKELLLPKVEAEFSIFNLIFLKTTPSKLNIIAPEIEINNINNKHEIALSDEDGQKILLQEGYSEVLSQIFSSLKSGNVAIKNFSITNAKINIRDQQKVKTIILEDSQISTSFKDNYLRLVLKNKFSFNPQDPNLSIDANCKFKQDEGLECDASFQNLIPSSISSFDSKLSDLSKISGNFSGNAKFIIDKNKHLSNASFDIITKSANFYYPEFFSGPIDLQNLIVSGNLNNNLKTFSLTNLNCNFGDTKFAMSLLASDFLDKNLQKTIMQFKINNVPTNNLKLLWPTFLNQNKVRDWFLGHIQNGTVKDGYATMILENKNGIGHLEKIESELAFSDLDLQYDQHFPPISKVSGIAFFNKNQMQIDISKGDVLDSKISFANVSIPHFHAKKLMLNIDGKIIGKAEDSLKHIDYKSDFAKSINQYFQGIAQTNISIKVPIKDDLSLADTYIKVDSNIDDFKNEYINNSNVKVTTIKNFESFDFVTEIDLTNTNIDLDLFGIIKKIGVESKIKTIISFDKKNILHLKKFDWGEENKTLKGSLSLQLDPIKISQIDLENKNFANSNFDLNYKIKDDLRFLRIKGESLNLKPLLEKDDSESGGFDSYQKNDIKINIEKLDLANNQKFTDVNIDLNCDGNICENGIISAHVNQEPNIEIAIIPQAKNKPTFVRGFIEDISFLSRGLNISNQILDGRVKLKSVLIKDGGLEGSIKISHGFTVLKNEVVDKIYSNDAFAKFKEQDLRNNKIEFRNLKLEFVFNDNVLNIKTLIANSYTLGFTAKGKIDLKNGKTNLKGLIVPGYALNKIFGIGRIPILGKIIVGEEGGGLFAVRYDYVKTKNRQKGDFNINPASAIIPGGIRNIFDLF